MRFCKIQWISFIIHGFFVIPAFAAGLDGRPAIESYFVEKNITQIDCLLSLTGFSLVGGPAYNDSSAAEDVLRKLDVNYIVILLTSFLIYFHFKFIEIYIHISHFQNIIFR